MNDDEFQRQVIRALANLDRCQQEIRGLQDRLLRLWALAWGLVVLLSIAVLVLALVPGQQLML